MNTSSLDDGSRVASVCDMIPRPTHRACKYRLLAKPPFTVEFRSVVYEIHIQKMTGCPQWHLRATSMSGRPNWSLIHSGEFVGTLERVIYEEGWELYRPSVMSLIMDRLVKEGRAELLSEGPPILIG